MVSSSAVAARSAALRSATRRSSSPVWRPSSSRSRACWMAIASGAAISTAMSRCSAVNPRGAVEARLTSPMASASTSSGTLSTLRIPSSRSSRRIAAGDSTAARSSIARTAPRRSTSPAESWSSGSVLSRQRSARREAGDQVRLAAGEVEQHDRAPVAGHHPAHAPERRASDLGGRARRQNRLVEVVQHRQPLGRAPEPLLGPLALGDVGDHADHAHRRPVPAGDGARRDQSPDLGAVLAAEAEVVALAARGWGCRARAAPPARAVASRKSYTGRPSRAPFW